MASILHNYCQKPVEFAATIKYTERYGKKSRRGKPIGPHSQFPSSLMTFVKIIIMGWQTDVQTYIKVITKDQYPEELRPVFCEHCQEEKFFHHHDYYERDAHNCIQQWRIAIHRFLCPTCRHTRSVLPTFIGPHKTVTWDVQEETIRKNESGMPLEQIAGEINPPAGPYSAKTMWRWKKAWNVLLTALEITVWEWLLKRIPHLALPIGKEKPPSAWQWLFKIWPQVKEKLSLSESVGLFQWLHRFSRSLRVAGDL